MKKQHIIFGVIVGILAFLNLFNVVEFPNHIQIPFISLFFTVWLFTAGIRAKQMYEEDLLDSFSKWMYAPLVIAILLLDVTFNILWGTIVFKELPREWLFTNRVKRHIQERKQLSRNYSLAIKWAARLNAIDPGHV